MLTHRRNCALIALALLILFTQPPAAAQQYDPRQVLAAVINQLQTGTPNPTWYGAELWQTIAMQTGNTGIYPQLIQIGPVQNVCILQQQNLPQGQLYNLLAEHLYGQTIWLVGIGSMSGRIEYASFNGAYGANGLGISCSGATTPQQPQLPTTPITTPTVPAYSSSVPGPGTLAPPPAPNPSQTPITVNTPGGQAIPTPTIPANPATPNASTGGTNPSDACKKFPLLCQ